MKTNILKNIIIFILCISFFAFAKKDESLEMEDMSHESHMPEEEFLETMKSFNVTSKKRYLEVYSELSGHGLPPASQLSKVYPNWLGFEEESSKGKVDVKWIERQLKSIESSESRDYELNELPETPDAKKQLKKPKSSKTLKAKNNGREKEKIELHDYEGFIDFIHHHSISKSKQYYALRNKNRIFKGKRLPANPHSTYPEWPGWGESLGNKIEYVSVEEIREMAKKEDIRNSRQYQERRKKNDTFNGKILPSNPNAFYENWPGWSNVFTKPKYMNFEEFKDFILKKKIRTRRQYIEIRKENHIVNGKILPSNPNLLYEEWTIWSDILFSPEYASIEEIKDFVMQKNIQTVEQYRAERQKDPIFNGKHLSSNPEKIYKSEWPGWNNIFVKPEHMNFEEFKDFILKKNIQSSKQYHEIRKKNHMFKGKILPANPNTFYEEWTVWGDILCEKTFKKTKKK